MSDLPSRQYIKQINNAVERLFSSLHDIWDEIGYQEDARQTYCEQAHGHLMGLMDDMLAETEDKRDRLVKTIATLLEEVHALSEELKTDPEVSNLTNEPLIDVQYRLKNQVDDLKQKKEQRLKYLKELQDKEREICKALGAQPVITNDGVPTYEELENFKFYVEKQESEKIRLENTFKDMRRSIMSIIDDLTYVPQNEFESLVCMHDEEFVYTANNMVQLREFRDNLKEQLDVAKEKVTRKRDELMGLWKFLEVPEESCRMFLEKYSGFSRSHLSALDDEIKRCKQRRTENIAKYVKKVREELKKLWDMCRFDEEQRKKFKPYYVDMYDENLLTLHDMEAERLRQYYNKNRKLYELLNERENMWEKGKELDQRANDPDRLHNRGGQLLLEEKERKLIQKKLPKLEEHIISLAQEYEAENGVPFTINGMSCEQFFMQSMEDYAEMKETLKKQRQAKSKDKSMKKTPVMSASRRTPATMSSLLRPGHTSVKRRDEKSPLGNSAKRNRTVQSEKARPTISTSRIRRSGRVPRRLIRAMNTSNRLSEKETTTTHDAHNTIGSVAQYEQFQEHLENREELRSSLLPEQVLKKAQGKPKMRTPVKTPVKPLRKKMSTLATPNKTPKSSHVRQSAKSPTLTSTPRLVAAPSTLPFFF